MNNLIFSNLQKWFRSIRRTQSEHPITGTPAHRNAPGTPSPEELRRALTEMLSDPESKGLLYANFNPWHSNKLCIGD